MSSSRGRLPISILASIELTICHAIDGDSVHRDQQVAFLNEATRSGRSVRHDRAHHEPTVFGALEDNADTAQLWFLHAPNLGSPCLVVPSLVVLALPRLLQAVVLARARAARREVAEVKKLHGDRVRRCLKRFPRARALACPRRPKLRFDGLRQMFVGCDLGKRCVF